MIFKRVNNYSFHTLLIFACGILFFTQCQKPESIFPDYKYQGYKTKLLLHDTFETDSDNWYIEGDGCVFVNNRNQLEFDSPLNQNGITLWSVDNFSGNFQIEYELNIAPESALNLVFICAKGLMEEDIITAQEKRTGFIEEYTKGKIQGYQIAYHSYSESGRYYSKSTVRKIPGQLLLAQQEEDPCNEARTYSINIIKISNRVILVVDGKIIHDVRDKGGFGNIHKEGKIGFWFQGSSSSYTATLDNIKCFKLIPE